MTRCLLETTAQIRRLTTSKGATVVRELLESVEDLSCITTVYVLMEVQRTICEDVLFVRDRVLEVDSSIDGLVRLNDIIEHLGTSPGIYSVRRSQRIILVTRSIIDFFSGEQFVPAGPLGEYLRTLAFEYMERAVRIRVSPSGPTLNVEVVNPSKCIARLMTDDDTELPPRITCRKADQCCAIDEFVTKYRPLVEEFLQMNDSNRDAKTVSLLAEVVDGTRDSLRGKRACWRVGDFLIALEAREAKCDLILSFDKQFLPLGKVVAIPRIPEGAQVSAN